MFKYIKEQIKLIRKNDPAINSNLEVFLYPCFKVLIYYKIAHFFYIKKHYFIARFLSERAKRKTGIEIHPGAVIGKNLFIDHGTGIVIGETTIIKDNVTIYSQTSILGRITIGKGAVIGGNLWITKDVPAGSTITLKNFENGKI